jgi:8-oxo-dGTP diphosphatase
VNREYPKRPLVGAGACILQQGKLLLIRRGAEPGRGRWSIPGGLVELGENVEDAMIREAKEEVGLDVTAVRLVDVFDSLTLDESGHIQYHFVVVNFLARIIGGKLQIGTDVVESRWVPLEEVEEFNLTKSFRAFFKKHKDNLSKWSDSA